jgi:integrase/recombinase XerC
MRIQSLEDGRHSLPAADINADAVADAAAPAGLVVTEGAGRYTAGDDRRPRAGHPPVEPGAAVLVVRPAEGALGGAAQWATLGDGELKRRAAEAAQFHDAATLWELTHAYLLLHGKTKARTSDHTVRSYRTGVLALLEAWAQENLLHPRRNAGALWVSQIAERHKPATVQSRLAAARLLYRALRWSGATSADPFKDTAAAPDHTPRHERGNPYSPQEVEVLLRHAGGETRLLILLCAHAGLRRSEALTLRWADLTLDPQDPARRTLVVRAGKGGRRRTVPLSATLYADLCRVRLAQQADWPRQPASRLRRTAGYVLSFGSERAAREHLAQACTAAGLPYRGLHGLRHACGTRLAGELKGDLETVARMLGHNQIETTRVYVQWSDRRLQSAVTEW